MSRWLAFLVPLFALLACSQPQIPKQTTDQALPAFPGAAYEHQPADQLYCVDSKKSQAEMLVRRGGSLARFGHDHVVVARDMRGIVLRPPGMPADSRADIRLDLRTLIVDEPELRKKYALDTEPTAGDIAKTTTNLQEKVLNTGTWPYLQLHIEGESETSAGLNAGLTIYLHGKVVAMPLMIHLEEINGNRIMAQGSFSLLQSDFGIEPFSILGGGLQVLDEVQVFFRIEAQQTSPDQRCAIGT